MSGTNSSPQELCFFLYSVACSAEEWLNHWHKLV